MLSLTFWGTCLLSALLRVSRGDNLYPDLFIYLYHLQTFIEKCWRACPPGIFFGLERPRSLLIAIATCTLDVIKLKLLRREGGGGGMHP